MPYRSKYFSKIPVGSVLQFTNSFNRRLYINESLEMRLPITYLHLDDIVIFIGYNVGKNIAKIIYDYKTYFIVLPDPKDFIIIS